MEKIDIEGLRSGIKASWDWENCAVCNQPLSTDCERILKKINVGTGLSSGIVKKVCCGITYFGSYQDELNDMVEYTDWRLEI